MSTKIIFGRPDIHEQDIRAAVRVIRSGWIGMGAVTAKLETAFRKYTGARSATAVSSGSGGLFLALLANGIGQGDEVITSPVTFSATANEVLHTGAEVRFADVDAAGNIDASKIEHAVTERTKAIIPVHLYGRPCDMDAIMKIARRYKLAVIEDAAHALGATYKGRSIGSIGDATVFSLYATKNITAAEGGIVTTNVRDTDTMMKLLRSYGISKTAWTRFGKANKSMPYDTMLPGYNLEIPDVLSALALSQFGTYARRFARRKQIWQQYDRHFSTLPVGLPPAYRDGRHAMHLYTITVDRKATGKDRETWVKELARMGIGTGIHFISLHLHAYFRKRYGYAPQDFPNALDLSRRTLSLPLTSGMTDEEVARVVRAVRKVCNG